MRDFFERELSKQTAFKIETVQMISRLLENIIATKEFSELYTRKIGAPAPLRIELDLSPKLFNLWRSTMPNSNTAAPAVGTFTAFATALVAAIQSSGASASIQQQIIQHLGTLDTTTAALQSDDTTLKDAEGTDSANITALQSDLATGLGVLQTGLTSPTAGASTGSPLTGTGAANNTGAGAANTTGAASS